MKSWVSPLQSHLCEVQCKEIAGYTHTFFVHMINNYLHLLFSNNTVPWVYYKVGYKQQFKITLFSTLSNVISMLPPLDTAFSDPFSVKIPGIYNKVPRYTCSDSSGSTLGSWQHSRMLVGTKHLLLKNCAWPDQAHLLSQVAYLVACWVPMRMVDSPLGTACVS